MVAGALEILGIDFGENRCSLTLEDFDIRGKHGKELDVILQKKSFYPGKWGFKYPHLHDHFEESVETLSQCKFVFVFRDVYSVALAWEKHHGTPIYIGLDWAQGRYNKLIRMYQQFKNSSHLISYEKALLNKELFVDQLASFVGINLDESRRSKLLDYISPGSYKLMQ